MSSLVKFELKKIVSRKATYISALIVFALLVLIYSLNVYAQQNSDNDLNTVSGLEGIALSKERADALAGPVTNESFTEKVQEYQTFLQGEGELKDEFTTEKGDTLPWARYHNAHDAYLSTFLAPWMNGSENILYAAWRVDTTNEVDLYEAIDLTLQNQLDSGMSGTWTYSEAERNFWQAKQAEVVEPLEYGYHGGWGAILDCFDFLMLVLLALCVGITPVFAAEYRERTDAVILATRYGKSRLVTAKIIASFIYALGMMLIGLLIAIGLPLLFYGAEGADLPVQLMSVAIPYALTMSQAVAVCAGIALVVTIGLTAFMLFLSAKWKSTLGIMMVGVALVFLPMFLPFTRHGLVVHFAVLFPGLSLSFGNTFRMLISYPLGSLVIDAQAVICLFYVLIAALFIPLAMRSFKRHQVE